MEIRIRHLFYEKKRLTSCFTKCNSVITFSKVKIKHQ